MKSIHLTDLVLCGGGWDFGAAYSMIGGRNWHRPAHHNNNLGVRLVRNVNSLQLIYEVIHEGKSANLLRRKLLQLQAVFEG